MKRFAFAVPAAALLAFVAGSNVMVGQVGGDPFLARSDRGETVHVLPPPAHIRAPQDSQPLVAPVTSGFSVYRASYGSGNLKNHGGHEIPNAGFFAIYYTNTVATASGSGVQGSGFVDIQDQISQFTAAFSDGSRYSESDAGADYTIIQQYGKTDWIANAKLSPALTSLGYYVDQNNTAPSTISDSQIQTYLASLFNNASAGVPASSSIVYGVYFPAGTTVTLGNSSSCSNFCGYHSNFTYNGLDIKYAAFPYPNCSGCKLSSLTVGDMLTIVSSHEIREAVTDADGSAWFDNAGYEADDKCAWHNLYQTANGGFWVQPEFSNGGTVTASGFTATYPQLSSRSGGCVVAK